MILLMIHDAISYFQDSELGQWLGPDRDLSAPDNILSLRTPAPVGKAGHPCIITHTYKTPPRGRPHAGYLRHVPEQNRVWGVEFVLNQEKRDNTQINKYMNIFQMVMGFIKITNQSKERGE